MNAVAEFVARRALRDGDRLPPERMLAAELGISRRALRQCLTEMELDGRVWRGRRRGTVLGRQAPAGSVAAAGLDRRLLRAGPADMLEARAGIEPMVAALAAGRATEADLAAIETGMRRTAEVTDDESWVRWDGAFHLAIAEAARNDIYAALIAGFNAARARPAWRAIQARTTTADTRRTMVAQHRAIVDALRRRSPQDARQAMRDHVASVQANFSG